VIVTAETGATLVEALVGRISGGNLTDYRTTTKYAQAEASGNGWTLPRFRGTARASRRGQVRKPTTS
jgi:hypothetical protein